MKPEIRYVVEDGRALTFNLKRKEITDLCTSDYFKSFIAYDLKELPCFVSFKEVQRFLGSILGEELSRPIEYETQQSIVVKVKRICSIQDEAFACYVGEQCLRLVTANQEIEEAIRTISKVKLDGYMNEYEQKMREDDLMDSKNKLAFEKIFEEVKGEDGESVGYKIKEYFKDEAAFCEDDQVCYVPKKQIKRYTDHTCDIAGIEFETRKTMKEKVKKYLLITDEVVLEQVAFYCLTQLVGEEFEVRLLKVTKEEINKIRNQVYLNTVCQAEESVTTYKSCVYIVSTDFAGDSPEIVMATTDYQLACIKQNELLLETYEYYSNEHREKSVKSFSEFLKEVNEINGIEEAIKKGTFNGEKSYAIKDEDYIHITRMRLHHARALNKIEKYEYRKEPTAWDHLKENGNLAIVKDLLIELEYENILDGDWACPEERSEARIFTTFNNEQKAAYALALAVRFAEKMLKETVEKFLNEFGDLYEEYFDK